MDRPEPLGPDDLTVLATDVGPAPMHMAAVLLVDGGDDGTDAVPVAFAARAAKVPRLTQRLVRQGHGAAWVADPGAEPARHLTTERLDGGGRRAVLDRAGRLLTTRLDPSRPLWAAHWLTGWDTSGDRRGALVVVLHHALVDGVGGLAALGALADDEPTVAPADPAAPRPPDPVSLRGLRAWWLGLRELGLGWRPPRPAARTSLNLPTGARRCLWAVSVPLAPFREGARRAGGTVNDAAVAAAVGTLTAVLATRGEHPRLLVVSVPVSRRPADGGPAGHQVGGNHTGVLPVAVPTGLDLPARVRHVAAATTRRKAVPRGRSSLPLGGMFRALARAGLFRRFVEHQRLVHTFETNLRGPASRLRIAGHEVSAMVPAAANPGNVAVSFAVLSYAGDLVVCAVTDPAVVPDPGALADALAGQLAGVAATPARVW